MLKTPLHNLHLELGAKMGQFAGFEMPLWYPDKILAEHHHTRSSASLFDISHMGQASVIGDESANELESLIPTNLKNLPVNGMRYCCFTNDQGGILDDLVVSRLDTGYHLVMNAARKEHDLQHLRNNLCNSSVVEHTESALIALQGPLTSEVLYRLNPDICDLNFMTIAEFDIKGVHCVVSRSGYTGEDGFEISMPAEKAIDLVKILLKEPEVKPAGLGARDSLRLEAGLRLYGQDMNIETTPVEAGIHWTISPSRRAGGDCTGGFPGSDIILQQLANGVDRKFIGMTLDGKAPARTGTEVALSDGDVIGRVTSGMVAPSIGKPVAMGYVESAHAVPGNEVNLLLRGKMHAAKVVRLPFVKHRYHKAV